MLKTLSLTASLLTMLALAAAAQTARIAHLSHAGNAETLAEAAALDNFGIIPPYFVVDSVRLLSDTTALEYGRWRSMHAMRDSLYQQKTNFVTYPRQFGWGRGRQQLVRLYSERRQQVKVLGADSTAPPAAPAKRGTQRKKSAFLPTVPAPPTHPGVGLGVAAILVFAGAGWLLGERRPQPA